MQGRRGARLHRRAGAPLARRARPRDAGARPRSSVGASVRASLALERMARAWALVHGRAYVVPVDVEQLFLPVVAHRLVFEPFALAVDGMSARPVAARARQGASVSGVAPVPEPDVGEREVARGVRALIDESLAGPRRRSSRSSRAIASPAALRRLPTASGADREPTSPARGATCRAIGSSWIDWNASARLSALQDGDEFVVREFYADEAPRVVIVVRPPPVDGPLRARASLALEAGRSRRTRSSRSSPRRTPPARTSGTSTSRAQRAGRASRTGYRRGGQRAPDRSTGSAPSFDAPADVLERAIDELCLRRHDAQAGCFVFVVSDFLVRRRSRRGSAPAAAGGTLCR